MTETTTGVSARPFLAYRHEVRAILEGRMTQFRRPMKPQPEPTWEAWNDGIADEGYAVFHDRTGPYTVVPNVHDASGIHDVHVPHVYEHLAPVTGAKVRCPFGAPGDVLCINPEGHDRHNHERRRDSQTDTDLPKRRLHGGERRGDIQQDKVQGFWQEGLCGREGAVQSEAGCTDSRGQAINNSAAHEKPRQILLAITDVRVERVCEISEAVAIAGGFCAERGDGITAGYLSPTEAAMVKGSSPRTWFANTWNRTFPNHPWGATWAWVVEFRPVEAHP